MFQWRINFNLAVRDAPDIIGMTEAVHFLARAIARIPLTPATQERLHRLNIVRAVRGTTGIEGVDLTDEEVNEIISSPDGPPVLPRARAREEMEARAAHNLFMRVENVLQNDISAELTEALICEFHEILTRDIDYRGNTPGEYRKRQVRVDTYEPPEHTEIPELMTRFIEWLNRGAGAQMDPVARAVVAHFLLVSIHPFGDGNGRLSRGVESFLLYKAGVNVRGFYSLSNYYYRERDAYIGALTNVRFQSDPDVTPFVRFALEGLRQELEDVHQYVIDETRLIAFHDYAREMIAHGGGLGRPVGLRRLNLILIIGRSEVPVAAIHQGHGAVAGLYRGVSNKTLSRDINALRDLELVVYENGVIRANIEVIDQYTAGRH